MLKDDYIRDFSGEIIDALKNLPVNEIIKASNIFLDAYYSNCPIYVIGNGGSWAMASHWVSDFNKTVFNSRLTEPGKRFRAVRLPSTAEELTAWANDVGVDMVFAGPLANHLQPGDVVVAISSSGNSPNIVRAVELAKKRGNRVVGVSGFDGGRLNQLADAKISVRTRNGEYEIVESVHSAILHLMTRYFREYFKNQASDNSVSI